MRRARRRTELRMQRLGGGTAHKRAGDGARGGIRHPPPTRDGIPVQVGVACGPGPREGGQRGEVARTTRRRKLGGGEVAQIARRQKYSPPTPRPPDAQGDGHGNEEAGEAGDGVEAASESERATHEGHWPCGDGTMDDMEGMGDGATPPRGGRRPRATPSDGQTGARCVGDTEGEQGDGNAVGAELTPAPSSTYSPPPFPHRLLACAHGTI